MATKNEGNKNINLGHGVGRRKTSVARVYLRDGNGKVTINGKDIAVYFVDAINAAKVVQPFEVEKEVWPEGRKKALPVLQEIRSFSLRYGTVRMAVLFLFPGHLLESEYDSI